MAHLELTKLPESAHKSLLASFAEKRYFFRNKPNEVPAGKHCFVYHFEDELRFGPAFFRLEVKGPFADKFNKLARGHHFFRYAEAYNPENNCYILERCKDPYNPHRELLVFDLSSGRKIAGLENADLRPVCWRPASHEIILKDWTQWQWKRWNFRSRKKDALIDIKLPVTELHITSDGRYLLANNTGRPQMWLYDLEADQLEHGLKPRHFKDFTAKPQTLHCARFYATERKMEVLINYFYKHSPKPSLTYDAAILVTITENG